MTSQQYSLDDIIEGQTLGATLIFLGGIAALALISDGFALASIGLVAPELLREWHLSPGQLVPAFTAGILGMMIGGPLFGSLGDHFGRKRMLQACLALIGLTTLLTVGVKGTGILVALRLLTGIGLGGMVPNVIALIAELAPLRLRGRMAVLATTGMILGLSIAGFTMAKLNPLFGWRSVMLVGGVIPLVVAVIAIRLPESIKYLATRPGSERQILAVARRLRPDLTLDDATAIVFPDTPGAQQRKSVSAILKGEFRLVSPLLWLILATTQLASFFAVTWLPTLLQGAGVPSAQAAAQTSLFSLGGLGGALLLIFVVDRYGVLALALLMVLAAPFFAMVTSSAGISPRAHEAIIMITGFSVLGAQQAVISLIGLFYPTAIRSSAAGIAYTIGRFGSLAAPALGGLLFQLHVQPAYLPAAPAVFLAVGAAAAGLLVLVVWRRFAKFSPQEFE